MKELQVTLQSLSKRYDREWIIKEVSYQFTSGTCYGITGRNGSGKSTLLRMIAGHLSPSRGQISFLYEGKAIGADQIPPLLSYVAPYIDPIEEFTLEEALRFHFKFKPLRPGLSLSGLPQELGLLPAAQQSIYTFSSGMKQRLMLGLALFSDTPLVLLDEPTTTLDQPAQQWFQDQLARHKEGRLVVIATNVQSDLEQCEAQMAL